MNDNTEPSTKANLSILKLRSTHLILDQSLFPSISSLFKPEEGGIHPREAADHHSDSTSRLLSKLSQRNDFDWKSIVAVAFSQGPGLGPCLRVGASVARTLSTRLNVPLIGVNHCVAHIEIGRNQTVASTQYCYT